MTTSILALGAILLFAFFLCGSLKVKPALAPLLSVVVLIDIIMVFAMFGALKAGTALAYGLAVIAGAYTVRQGKDDLKTKITDFFAPGVIFFVISRLGMLWILSSTQPVFHGWDEFSFWGTARKIVDKFDALYTYHNTSMLGQSIPPAMPVLTYFFNFFGNGLTEWVCYFGYDLLFLACFAAFTAPLGKKEAHTAFAVYAIGFALPFVFEITDITSKLASTYISAYGDIPMALIFAAALAVYFYNTDSQHSLWQTLPVLMFLTLIKDMGFALACIVVFVAFFDMLAGRKEFTLFKLKGFFAKCAAAFAMLTVTAGSFVGWSMHISKVLQIDRNNFSESKSIGMAEMLIRGVKELFGIRQDRFRHIYESMIEAFFSTKVSMAGAGLTVVILITGIFFLAFILGDKKGRKRAAMMYITTWTGFIGYYVFHLFLYVYLFKNDGYDLVSYDRYMYIFYIGWLCAGLICLVQAVADGHNLLAKGSIFAFGFGLMVLINLHADMGNTFMAVAPNSFPKRLLVSQKAEFISDRIGKDDIIYIASEDNDGEHWFIYTYELLDNYIVPDHYVWEKGASREERDEMAHRVMAGYFKQNGVTHLLLDNVNEEYIRRYQQCFDVDISDIAYDNVAYFKLSFEGDSFRGTLVKGGSIND